jgi:hypothetical protein
VDRYDRLYAGKYAPKAYVKEVRAMIDLLQRRHDVAGRAVPVPPRPETEESQEEATQAEFRWASGREG